MEGKLTCVKWVERSKVGEGIVGGWLDCSAASLKNAGSRIQTETV
jgi:hypothetical protein